MLVTGAAKRLGRSVALRLAEDGADVVVHYATSRREAALTAREIRDMGRRALLLRADLRSVAQIRRIFAAVKKAFARLDILVNSAAVFEPARIEKLSEEQWDRVLDTNLKGQFFCAQAAAPLLARSGRGVIVNFASTGGLLAWPGYTHYCVSKAGVIMLTRCLAKALAPRIRVNAVAPGTISMQGDPSDWEKDFVQKAPLGRTGKPEEIADAVAYLVKAKFVTGQVLVVDGGRTL